MSTVLLQNMNTLKHEPLVKSEDEQIIENLDLSITEKIKWLYSYNQSKYTQKYLSDYFILTVHEVRRIVNEEAKIKDIKNPIIHFPKGKSHNPMFDLPILR